MSNMSGLNPTPFPIYKMTTSEFAICKKKKGPPNIVDHSDYFGYSS